MSRSTIDNAGNSRTQNERPKSLRVVCRPRGALLLSLFSCTAMSAPFLFRNLQPIVRERSTDRIGGQRRSVSRSESGFRPTLLYGPAEWHPFELRHSSFPDQWTRLCHECTELVHPASSVPSGDSAGRAVHASVSPRQMSSLSSFQTSQGDRISSSG